MFIAGGAFFLGALMAISSSAPSEYAFALALTVGPSVWVGALYYRETVYLGVWEGTSGLQLVIRTRVRQRRFKIDDLTCIDMVRRYRPTLCIRSTILYVPRFVRVRFKVGMPAIAVVYEPAKLAPLVATLTHMNPSIKVRYIGSKRRRWDEADNSTPLS
jgi:hypothetical protein